MSIMGSIRKRATSGAKWLAVGSVSRVALQVVQLAVLTRLLAPEDFGVASVVLVAVSIGTIFSDAGLSSAFLQRQAVTDEARSSLYWLNVIIATVVALGGAILAPTLAWAYGTPGVAGVMWTCCPIFVLGALGRQFEVASEKALKFRPLVLIETMSAAVGVLIAIICAIAGWRAYSLAAAALATAAIRAALAFALLSAGWRPKARLNLAEARPYAAFGGAALASNLINQLNSSIDLVLGGRLLGLDAIGMYSVPKAIVLNVQNTVNPIVTRIGFPVIAELQADRDAVRRAYAAVVNVVAVIGTPVYVCLTILAEEICELLLGEAWKGAATTLSILALWGALRSLGNPVGALLLGVGRAGVALIWNLTVLAVFPLALWIGSSHGVTGLATSLLITVAVLFVPCWRWLVYPYCGWRLKSYAATTLVPILAASASFLIGRWCAAAADFALARALLTFSIGWSVYLIFVYFTNPAVLQLVRDMLEARFRKGGVSNRQW
jgi:O-antigen/teichoic acid export membrane protein